MASLHLQSHPNTTEPRVTEIYHSLFGYSPELNFWLNLGVPSTTILISHAVPSTLVEVSIKRGMTFSSGPHLFPCHTVCFYNHLPVVSSTARLTEESRLGISTKKIDRFLSENQRCGTQEKQVQLRRIVRERVSAASRLPLRPQSYDLTDYTVAPPRSPMGCQKRLIFPTANNIKNSLDLLIRQNSEPSMIGKTSLMCGLIASEIAI